MKKKALFYMAGLLVLFLFQACMKNVSPAGPGVENTFTPVVTVTATSTQSATGTAGETDTITPTQTGTFTFTATAVNTMEDTFTFTPSVTGTFTHTHTPSLTITETDTKTATETITGTASPTFTVTLTYTNTGSFTATKTVTVTSTSTNTPTSTATSTSTPDYTATMTSMFVAKWNATGNAAEQWQVPWGIAVDTSTGNIVIADNLNARINVLDPSTGIVLKQFGKMYETFSSPTGVGVDSAGKIYCTDQQYSSRITVYTGNVSTGYYCSVTLSSLPGMYSTNYGQLFVNPGGKMYTPMLCSPYRYNTDGSGEEHSPYSVVDGGSMCVYSLGVAANRANTMIYAIYETSTPMYYVYQYDASFNYVKRWGGNGTGNGQLRKPACIAVDDAGNVYVADSVRRDVQKFDANGNFIMKWGSNGSGIGQFTYPTGIAVDSSGNVYVTDRNNSCIQKFKP